MLCTLALFRAIRWRRRQIHGKAACRLSRGFGEGGRDCAQAQSKGNIRDDAALPTHLDQLPRYLRNAISHFNIRLESADGQELTHLLVWNQVPNTGRITFVARVHIKGLRRLAVYVLERLSKSGIGDRYEAIDPIAKFDQQDEPTSSS